MKRAQAGIEYIIMVGLLLFFLIPTLHFAVSEANLQIKINQLDNAVRRIAKSANAVYAVGPGSQEVVTITLPKGVTGFSAAGHDLLYQTTLFGQTSDFHYSLFGTLNGTLPVQAGTYRILVTAMEGDLIDVRLRKIS